ncbi:MAG: hypothetical protein R3D28_11720 [Geminicoccaceae bacterium]
MAEQIAVVADRASDHFNWAMRAFYFWLTRRLVHPVWLHPGLAGRGDHLPARRSSLTAGPWPADPGATGALSRLLQKFEGRDGRFRR